MFDSPFAPPSKIMREMSRVEMAKFAAHANDSTLQLLNIFKKVLTDIKEYLDEDNEVGHHNDMLHMLEFTMEAFEGRMTQEEYRKLAAEEINFIETEEAKKL